MADSLLLMFHFLPAPASLSNPDAKSKKAAARLEPHNLFRIRTTILCTLGDNAVDSCLEILLGG